MADYIYPYGEMPDDAPVVLYEEDPNIINGKVLLPGDNISITVGQGTVTISSTGGGTDNATFITATDETADLPNSFQVIAGSNIALDYVGNQLIISASASGTAGGTVTSVSSANATPLFTTSVATATTTPAISYTISSAASGTFFSGPASGANATANYRGILGTDLTGALLAGSNITITPAAAPGSRLTINAVGFQPLSSVLNALASSLTGTGYVVQTGPDAFAERTFQGSTYVTITNPAGIAGDSTISLSPKVLTTDSSDLLNALSSATGTGIVARTSEEGVAFRTIQGSSNITVTNPAGIAGDPALDVTGRVFTVATSSLLNALSSSTQGGQGGIYQLSDTSFINRTLTGTTGRVVITNPLGLAGAPTFDVGDNVYTISSSNALNALATSSFPPANGHTFIGNNGTYSVGPITALPGVQITLGAGLIQIGASGANGGTVTSFSTDNFNPVYSASVNTATTTPHLVALLNQQASGAALIGPINGANDEPTFRRLLGDDLTDAVIAGANVTIELTNNQLIISSTASGGGGGSVTSVSSGDANPLFTTNVATATTTPAISYTLSNAASGTFFAGPASGVPAPGTYRGILGTDLAGALAAGTNITLTPQADPNSRITIALSSGIDATFIANGSVSNTEFQYLNGATSNIQTQLNSKLAASNNLNALSSGTGTGYMSRIGDGDYAYRTLTGTSGNVTVTNGTGAGGDSVFDVGARVFTVATSSLLNALSSATAGSTGLVTQLSNTSFINRTLTGTANRVTVTNGNGVSGNPTVDVGTDVYTISSSNVLNDLASSTSTGMMAQTDSIGHHAYRTITGTGNRVSVTNGNGVSGDPTLDVGTDVYTISTSNILNNIASSTGTGVVVQTTAAGAQARRTITGTGTNITVINGDGISANPTIDTGANVYTRSQSSLLNYLASTTPAQGQIPMGQSDGSYILTKPNAGAGVQITYTNGVMTIGASGAGSGGGGGYATIQEEGTPLTQRTTMNFIGAAITAADDAGNTRTNISAHTSVNSIAVTPTNGQIPIGNGTNFTVAQPTAGNGIQITSGAGTLNIGASATMFGVCNGRLTLTSGVPVTSSNVTAATTLYFSPYNGNAIGLWNLAASGWNIYNFTEKSVAIPSTTNTNYDVFLDDSQTLRTVAWTNNTTRASNIVLFDGIYVRHGQANWRYLGSIRTTGTTGQCEDSTSRRFVWNMYNQIPRNMVCFDTTDSWTYSSNSWRASNNSSTDGVGRVSFILGLNTAIKALALQTGYISGATGKCAVGIGINSTTVNSAKNGFASMVQLSANPSFTNDYAIPISASYKGIVDLGFSFISSLEIGPGSGTMTWYGDDGSTTIQTGMNVCLIM